MGQQDLKIHELVSKIERGDIRLPEMQRQYVWKSTRIRDLLDSLYRGYPSGTILTWETDEPIATRDFSVAQSAAQGRYQLLLDGQQRLTSLSAIVRGEPLFVGGRKRPIDVLFNLEHPDEPLVTEVEETTDTDEEDDNTEVEDDVADATEDELLKRFDRMAFVVRTEKLAARANWVSVSEVFRDNSDAAFLKKAGVTSFEDPRYQKYTSRLKKLRDIKEYNYRVHILDRDKSYEEVTEIFVRVNSLGAKLRSSDLALAQITAKWRNSLAVFQEFQQQCHDNGFALDLGLILKNLISVTTGQSRFKTISSLSLADLEEGWKQSTAALRFALNFFKSNVQIDSLALLSSPFVLLSVAYFGHHKGYHLTTEEERSLRQWVLIANAKARYSRGSSETFLDQDLSAIRRNGDVSALFQQLRTQVGRLRVLPADLENRNSRSAYFKTMFQAFRAEGAKDWQDQLVISLRHAGPQNALQFHHIFPQDVLKKRGITPHAINDICNLAFISGKTNRHITNKPPSDYLLKIIRENGTEALEKQCIPTDAGLWAVDAYDAFLARRRELIAAQLNSFLGQDASAQEEAA